MLTDLKARQSLFITFSAEFTHISKDLTLFRGVCRDDLVAIVSLH